jgi:hypothetical protein
MNLRKSIERIEKRIGVSENWDQLWNRYREIYRCNGQPLHKRVSSPYPPCTTQDALYEQFFWVEDRENGGIEMALAKERFTNPDFLERRLEGIDIEHAAQSREFCEILTPIYSAVLKELSKASHKGYNNRWLDPVISSCFRNEVGNVNFSKIDKALARIENAHIFEIENYGYGPEIFRLFREAGSRGDHLICDAHKKLIEDE